MYIKRTVFTAFKEAVSYFPAVLVTGPRQSGKTTFLLNEGAKTSTYVTFDDPLQREFATADPQGFLEQFDADRSVVLDEVQYVPDLFPYLKMWIDAERSKTGKWILTGSQQFHLMKNISESLAGRIALMDLLPFDYLELSTFSDVNLEEVTWNSAYPEPAIMPEKRDLWLRSYVQTYVERDVRQLLAVKDLSLFTLFLTLAASRHGQEFKKSVFSRDIGVSQPTIKKWAGIMEASYLIHLLQPYYRNFGKRVIKSPKLYFIDAALVAYLTKQPDQKAAIAGAMGGALFEGWVVSETLKAFYHAGRRPEIYFWRSHDGLEVDLLIVINGKIYPVEIKLTATPRVQHMRPLQKFKKLAGKDNCGQGILVCRIKKKINMPGGNMALPWDQYPLWLYDKLHNADRANCTKADFGAAK